MRMKIFLFLITPADIWIRLMGLLCFIEVRQDVGEIDDDERYF